jgi:hypothetical protein
MVQIHLISSIAEVSSSWPNVEVWHRLQGAPLRPTITGSTDGDRSDTERVAGCPPPVLLDGWPISLFRYFQVAINKPTKYQKKGKCYMRPSIE